MLKFDSNGIFCEQAGVYIDPWKPVEKALITHGHSDHARFGSKYYLCHHLSVPILRLRLGNEINVQGINYNEPIHLNGVKISFHPAGHIIGSAQIRLEYKGEVWVVSGDYKLSDDGMSTPFEPVSCNHFITESTFGLPVYNFPEPKLVHDDINNWWRSNRNQGKNSIIIGYALGKAQRIIHHLDKNIGDVFLHGAVSNVNDALSSDRPLFPFTRQVFGLNKKDIQGAIIVAPPGALGSPWLNRFEPYSLGICSGWMALRGARRRRNADRGFVLSDHCDWNELNTAVQATGAKNVYVTHGYKTVYAKWLREKYKLNASEVETLYEGENIEENKPEEQEQDKNSEELDAIK